MCSDPDFRFSGEANRPHRMTRTPDSIVIEAIWTELSLPTWCLRFLRRRTSQLDPDVSRIASAIQVIWTG